MEIEAAIKKAMSDPQIMAFKNYFLASAFSIIEEGQEIREWTLLFYDKRAKKTIDCYVSEKFVTIGQEMPAQKEMAELRTEGMKIGIGQAMKTARGKYSKKIINILITLHYGDRPVWTITFVATDITATSFDIDALDGKVIREETISLMRKEK